MRDLPGVWSFQPVQILGSSDEVRQELMAWMRFQMIDLIKFDVRC